MFKDTTKALLNTDWLFLGPEKAQQFADCTNIPEGCQAVQLPHAWNEGGWTYESPAPKEPAGVGWYFRTLPAIKDVTHISLQFDGISAAAEVFLNGKLIANNLSAYKPFEVVLDNIKSDGSDLLAVKVTDKSSIDLLPESDDPFSQSPRYERWAITMGSSMAAGGIWRDVWLITSDGPRMQTPHIESGMKSLLVKTDVNGAADNTKIRYCLYDDSGNLKYKSITEYDELSEIIPENIKLWSPRSPVLYTLETSLLIDDEVWQTITQPVAFYEFCIRDSEFYFNGRPYFLRGQNGFPHCNIPHDREYIRRYVTRIKDQGVEINRFHTEPPCHAWLDECDRQGIMVIFEMALHGSMGCYPLGNPQFQKNYVEELRALIQEYRRHPSIMMWCLGNEIIVNLERNLGLAKNLFNILETWVDEVRRLDPRPVIANSGGDGADLVQKTVGDVDDNHQYGGWYTENLYDVRNFEKYVRKNEMLFQPMISTESVAAYTDNEGRFFLKHRDVRQHKVIRQRFGNPDEITPQECMKLQSYIFKEYAEAMWRMRRDDTNVSGYIPFGQYTWFSNPFDKGPDGLQDKPIWEVYRKLMGPVHVQFECWQRHAFYKDRICGNVILNHEDSNLPSESEFTIVISTQNRELYRKTITLKYHRRFYENIELDVSFLQLGDHVLTIEVFCDENRAAINDRDIRLYSRDKIAPVGNILVYDPTRNMLELCGEIKNIVRLNDLSEMDFTSGALLIIGPYAMDRHIQYCAENILRWFQAGNKCLVLEQLPDKYTQNMMATGIGVHRGTQPYWSRWATNMVRNSDRADICDKTHPIFRGVDREDMTWWNGDTRLADSFLRIAPQAEKLKVLSGIAHGLADDELMPVEHSPDEQDYNPLIIEQSCGSGKIIFCNLLIGRKYSFEPAARKLMGNMILYLSDNRIYSQIT